MKDSHPYPSHQSDTYSKTSQINRHRNDSVKIKTLDTNFQNPFLHRDTSVLTTLSNNVSPLVQRAVRRAKYVVKHR